MANKPDTKISQPKDRLLSRLSLTFFDRPKMTFVIWLVLVVFGAVSYTTLLKREGFPSINIPIAIVNGTYFVNDPAQVDARLAKPIGALALKQDGVITVQTTSSGNFYNVVIQYEESIDAQAAAAKLKKQIAESVDIPQTASVDLNVPHFGVTGGDSKKIDDLISLYRANGQATTSQLVAPATQAVEYLNQHKPALVKEFFLQDPFSTATDPATGQEATVQRLFDRYSHRTDGTVASHNSVSIGVTGVDNVDVIKLDKQLETALAGLHKQDFMQDYSTTISASNAPSIKDEISELQRVLLEGLVAVLVIGSIVIAIRASLITVISMITVILIVLGFLFLIGYSLNVITLFALILGLSLIVDDTIIMTEAIDAVRRRSKDRREIVKTAVRKISRAMVAATFTAALSFAPLLFASGVLGSFIRAIPVTIIAALLISLFVALVFIPFFARGLLLRPKQLGSKGTKEMAEGLERRIAQGIARPMLWAKGSTKRLTTVGLIAVFISLLFIGSAGYIFSKVTFNIFPPTKDSNMLSVTLTFKPGTTIAQAETITREADKLVTDTLGENFVNSSYYSTANETTASSFINLIPYDKRDITSPELVEELQKRFNSEFTGASAQVGQVDVGPPISPFIVEIRTEDRAKGYELASDMQKFLQETTLTRPSGTKAHFTNVSVSSPSQYTRSNGVLTINITAGFDADDTTTLVTLGQNVVNEKFNNADTLKSYGLSTGAIAYNIGQESENQDSFKSLALAFPILLLAIYILLIIEFRSFLQPLLIFMAIPFSLFGVTLGLYLTDNAFSFFAMLGFFALIGLSLKNTILLTDYANQAKRAGMGAVDSAVEALSERFRPLIATSLTAVVSLIPLAITSPFWQGLAVVLIFGLLSSTLLVILIFPYYYLGGEFLRRHISAKSFFVWLFTTVVAIMVLSKISRGLILPTFVLSLITAIVVAQIRKRRRA